MSTPIFQSLAVFTAEELAAYEQQIRADEQQKAQTYDLRIEECALHTEKPEWAAHAPEQVVAAVKRGADIISFTELHGTLAAKIGAQVGEGGYTFFNYDAGSTAIAWKKEMGGTAATVSDRTAKLVFDFHGHTVTFFSLHWPKNSAANKARRATITANLVKLIGSAADGHGLAFFAADSNPSKALSDPVGEPRASLNKGGIVLINEELGYFPEGQGVATIGHAKRDTRVVAKSLEIHPALGSDHRPVVATWSIR